MAKVCGNRLLGIPNAQKEKKFVIWRFTLPKTNSSHLPGSYPKRKRIFHPSIFRCYVSFTEGKLQQPQPPTSHVSISPLAFATSRGRPGPASNVFEKNGIRRFRTYSELDATVRRLFFKLIKTLRKPTLRDWLVKMRGLLIQDCVLLKKQPHEFLIVKMGFFPTTSARPHFAIMEYLFDSADFLHQKRHHCSPKMKPENSL